jgi:hypothetical protein
MYKVKKQFEKKLPPITLYARELAELEKILTKDGRTIRVIHNDYHFDSIDELIKETKVSTIYNVDLFSQDAKEIGLTVWVKLHKGGASVLSLDIDDRPQQLASEVYHFLEEFKTPVAYYVKWLCVALLLPYLLVASSSDTVLGLPVGLYPYFKGHIFLQFLYFIFFGIMLSYPFMPSLAFQRCKIILKHRGEIPTFWATHKDKMVFEVMKVIAGAIIGIIGTVVVKNGCNQPVNPIVPTTQTSKPTSQP